MPDVWRAEAYLRHAGPRERPALDLFEKIADDAVPDGGRAWDLGCGHGRLTALVADRWPTAEVVGVDSSADMLRTAQSTNDRDGISWHLGGMLERTPAHPLDLIVANASLHWLDDHRRVLPRLVTWLRRHGTLAVQMPRNHDEPTHRVIADVVLDVRWRDRLLPVLRPYPVAPAPWVHELLRTRVSTLDVWETTYLHPLTGKDPVLSWVAGSVLRPILALLDDDEAADFEAAVADGYRAAYPPSADGTTVLPFTRQFIIATR